MNTHLESSLAGRLKKKKTVFNLVLNPSCTTYTSLIMQANLHIDRWLQNPINAFFVTIAFNYACICITTTACMGLAMGCSGRKGEAIRQCNLWLHPSKCFLWWYSVSPELSLSQPFGWWWLNACESKVSMSDIVASTAFSKCSQLITIAVNQYHNNDVWWWCYMWS